jgi:hypothetical protein
MDCRQAAEVAYLGRDNTIELVLLEDGARVPLAGFTRYQLEVGALVLDSQTVGLGAGQAFDASTTRVVDGRSVPVLRLRLGGQSVPAGDYQARLVAFSAAAPNGLVFGSFPLRVAP